MAGYLDSYGSADVRRERMVKRVGLVLLIAAIAAGAGYFFLRNYSEDRQLANFVDLLARKDYAAAYKLWGCSVEQPCRDYNWQRFQEDWGAQSPHADIAAMRVEKVKSCEGGVIRALKFPKDEVLLIVNRADLTISFAPFERQCAPTFKVPVTQ